MKVLDLLLTLALYQPTTISCVCLYIIDINLNINALLVCTQHIMECTCTYMYMYWEVQEKAQLLTEQPLKIASKNSTKNHATFSQYVLNHIENFQSKRTTIVEITGA